MVYSFFKKPYLMIEMDQVISGKEPVWLHHTPGAGQVWGHRVGSVVCFKVQNLPFLFYKTKQKSARISAEFPRLKMEGRSPHRGKGWFPHQERSGQRGSWRRETAPEELHLRIGALGKAKAAVHTETLQQSPDGFPTRQKLWALPRSRYF